MLTSRQRSEPQIGAGAPFVSAIARACIRRHIACGTGARLFLRGLTLPRLVPTLAPARLIADYFRDF